MPVTIAAGTVVRFNGPRDRRRYVVTVVRIFGEGAGAWEDLALCALSGGQKACGPTQVKPRDLVVDADQSVTFTGAEAAYLRRKYEEVIAGATIYPVTREAVASVAPRLVTQPVRLPHVRPANDDL